MATDQSLDRWAGRVLTHYVHDNGGLKCNEPIVTGGQVVRITPFTRADLPNFPAVLNKIPLVLVCTCGELLVRA